MAKLVGCVIEKKRLANSSERPRYRPCSSARRVRTGEGNYVGAILDHVPDGQVHRLATHGNVEGAIGGQLCGSFRPHVDDGVTFVAKLVRMAQELVRRDPDLLSRACGE